MVADLYRPIRLPDYRVLPVEDMRARADAFHAMMRKRRTVRDFSPRPVPRDIIERCLETAGTAPSGANRQPWHFAIVGDPERKKRVRAGAEEEERKFYAGKAGAEWLAALAPLGTDPNKPFLELAPWLICVFGARASRGADGVLRKNYYVPESVALAAGFLVAALHHAGLATLTHTPSPMGFLNAICERPANEKPYMLVVTGYPADDATVPASALSKKPLNEISTFFT